MKKIILLNLAFLLVTVKLGPAATCYGSEGVRPIADAGLSRYAAEDTVVLGGTGSYDPDESGPLSYNWQQITGLSVVISSCCGKH